MIARGARVMAVATFASVRCVSFLHGGMRLVRTGPHAGRHLAALYSSTQVEQGTKIQGEGKGRGNADDASLDTLLISTRPELVVEHLKARRAGEESLGAVDRIGGKPAPILIPWHSIADDCVLHDHVHATCTA